jgi:hypothetical protein
MTFGERAKHASEQARQAAADAAVHARETATVAGGQVRDMAGSARRSIATVVERIDPSLLADVIVKATALQERTNAALRRKGSAYRIAEVTITATIPPQVGFSIARIGDIDDEATGSELDSTEVLRIGRVGDDAILSLDGDEDPTAVGGIDTGSPDVPSVDAAAQPAPASMPTAPAPSVSAPTPPGPEPGQVPAPTAPRFGPLWGPELNATMTEPPRPPVGDIRGEGG